MVILPRHCQLLAGYLFLFCHGDIKELHGETGVAILLCKIIGK